MTGRHGGRSPRRLPLVALLALVPAIHLVVLVPELWTTADQPRDLTAYSLAADRVRQGASMYEPVAPGPHEPGVGAPYLYPPFLAAIAALVPLTGTGFARMGLLAGVLCFWVYAACLARIAWRRVTAYGVLLWGAALTAGLAPLGALYVGQIDSLIWALFGLALAYPAVRGFGFAASAMIKPFAVWPLGLALWRERRPALLGAVGAVGLAVLLASVAVGPRGLVAAAVTWLTTVYPSLAQGQFTYRVADVAGAAWANHLLGFLGTGNLSLGFLPLQLARAAGWLSLDPGLPGWARAYLTLAGIAAPIAALWFTRHRSPALRYSSVMAAAVLFGPIFRATYAPILYAFAAAWLGGRNQDSSTSGQLQQRFVDAGRAEPVAPIR